MPFSPLYYRPALAKVEYESTHPFATVPLWHGGWVGWWVNGLVGGWVCHAVRAWCLVGKLEEADVVLVRFARPVWGLGFPHRASRCRPGRTHSIPGCRGVVVEIYEKTSESGMEPSPPRVRRDWGGQTKTGPYPPRGALALRAPDNQRSARVRK